MVDHFVVDILRDAVLALCGVIFHLVRSDINRLRKREEENEKGIVALTCDVVELQACARNSGWQITRGAAVNHVIGIS